MGLFAGLRALFFLIALGAIIKRLCKRAIVTLVDNDAFDFFNFFAAGIAFHKASSLSDTNFEVKPGAIQGRTRSQFI